MCDLSFKPKTDDIRRSPSIELIKNLVREGAQVTAYDPVVNQSVDSEISSSLFTRAATAMEAIVEADALVLVTEWNEFKEPNFLQIKEKMRQPIVFDGRNIYNPKKLRDLGFEYCGIGQRP